jgi:MFS family permease
MSETQTASTTPQFSSRRLLAMRWAVNYYFTFTGMIVTLWAVHIPQTELRLGLTHAQVGTFIVASGFGGLLAMQLMGHLIDRVGSKRSTVYAGVVLGVAACIPGIMTNFWALCGSLFVLGFCLASTDVSMNAQAVDVEKEFGRPIFSSFHAYWSLGGLLGAGLGGLALANSIPIWVTLPATGIIGGILSFVLGKHLAPSQPVHAQHHAKLSKAESRALKTVQNKANRPVLGLILLLGALSASAALVEGVGIDWASLFEVRELGATQIEGAMAVLVFSGGMALFRLIADRFVARFGRLLVIRMGSLLAGLGVALSLAIAIPAVSIVGWLVAGVGISAVVPQLFAYSAGVGEASHSGRNMAKVFGVTYAGMLGGPALIGWLTTMFPLRQALLAGVALAAIVAVVSWFLPKQNDSTGVAAGAN